MQRHRGFRRRSTGQWLDVLFTADNGPDADEPPELGSPAADQAADLAAALGIDPADLEAVEDDADPRAGELLEIPVVVSEASRIMDKGRDGYLDLIAIAKDAGQTAVARRIARDTAYALRAIWSEVRDTDPDA